MGRNYWTYALSGAFFGVIAFGIAWALTRTLPFWDPVSFGSTTGWVLYGVGAYVGYFLTQVATEGWCETGKSYLQYVIILVAVYVPSAIIGWYIRAHPDSELLEAGYELLLKVPDQVWISLPFIAFAVMIGFGICRYAWGKLRGESVRSRGPGRIGEHRMPGAQATSGEITSDGHLRGWFRWVASLLAIGAMFSLVLVVLFSLDLVSPREKPCPHDSLPLPPPGFLYNAGDFWNDSCVRIDGTVSFRDLDELVIDVDRGEFAQREIVRGPTGVFEAIDVGDEISLAGRLRADENGIYVIDFIPGFHTERGWRRNLTENLRALF